METKENVNNSKSSFFKTKGFLFLLISFIVIFMIACLCMFASSSKDNLVSKQSNSPKQTTTDYSIAKIVYYSSGYGMNNEETQARWNLNLSQFTDIAIYLNSPSDISSIYIDNISYSNEGNTYHLTNLPIENFAKTPASNIEVVDTERIDLDSSSPITLRYFNQNFKENCVITDIETPLVFNGSLLKRGKVTLSSLKNTIFFTIHLTNTSGQEFTYPVELPIPLENKETEETIYSGNYMTESFLTDAYFYMEH